MVVQCWFTMVKSKNELIFNQSKTRVFYSPLSLESPHHPIQLKNTNPSKSWMGPNPKGPLSKLLELIIN